MLKVFSVRMVNLIAAALVVGLLGLASYLQHVKGLEPCPLCMVQRFAFMILGVLFFVGIFLPPSHVVVRRIHNTFIILFAGAGVAAAARQLWLIHFATGFVPACGADFYYLLHNLPWGELLTQILQGTGDCTKEAWQFLHISLPTWSLLALIFFAVIGFWQMLRRNTT